MDIVTIIDAIRGRWERIIYGIAADAVRLSVSGLCVLVYGWKGWDAILGDHPRTGKKPCLGAITGGVFVRVVICGRRG